MDTLIELYDERAIENILAPDMFRPKRIVYLCPEEIAQDRKRQEKLRAFFQRRGWEPEVTFMTASLFKADRIFRQLLSICEKYPDCAVDVTGGSDAALFAAGMFSARTGAPAFTYSRKKNSFYDISGADFADNLECTLSYSVEDFFLMAGGTLLPGRVDNAVLEKYLKDFDRFFDCFLRFRRDWSDIISYIQRVSPGESGQTPPLSVQGEYTVKGDHGSRNSANEAALKALADLDFIRDLSISSGQSVSFRFRDLNIRAWLRDVGSVLELYTYKACMDAGIFNDVISSAVVRWDDVQGHSNKNHLFKIEEYIKDKPEFLKYLTNPSVAPNGLQMIFRSDCMANPMLWYLMGATEGCRETPVSLDEIKEIAATKPGFIRAMWCGEEECELKLKEEADISSRCMPFEDQEQVSDVCVCCGKPAKKMVVWAKAY